MDTRRGGHRGSRTGWTKSDALGSNPARHGVVERALLSDSDVQFTTQVVVFGPELPDHTVVDESPFGTVVVSAEKEQRPPAPRERARLCDTSRIHGNGGERSGNRQGFEELGGLFDSLEPDDKETVKGLRVFYESGVEFKNGASSLRQISERLGKRQLKEQSPDYPADLPASLSEISRCRTKVLEFFGERFGMGMESHIFKSHGKGKAFFGLTDFGWDLWKKTERYLASRGFIPEIS